MSNISTIFVKNKKNMENLSGKHVLPTKVLLSVPKENEKKTESGIIIPGSANKISSKGTVVIVGSGIKDVEIGNQVMFSPHAGIKVVNEGEEYTLIWLQDVLLFW